MELGNSIKDKKGGIDYVIYISNKNMDNIISSQYKLEIRNTIWRMKMFKLMC